MKRRRRSNVMDHVMGTVGEVADQLISGTLSSLTGTHYSNPWKQKFPRGAAMENVAAQYSEQFPSQWYEPYLDTAIREPAAKIQQDELRQLTPEAFPGFPQELLAGYTGGTPYIHKGGSADLAAAAEELEGAREDYMGQMDELQTEEEKVRLAKAEADKRTSFERGQFLREQPSAEEARQAKIAKTGMAYSGPAERAATISRGKETKTLRDITEAKRAGQRTFAEGIEGVKKGREEAYGGYTDAERDFGTSIMDTISGGGEQISDLINFAWDLPSAHQQFGRDLEAGQRWETSADAPHEWYSVRNAGKANIFGQPGGGAYQAPSQAGWFNEPATGEPGGGFPELASASNVLGQAADFAEYLGGAGGITPGQISDMLSDPTWTSPTGEVWSPDDEG